jgi:hypothetical protein
MIALLCLVPNIDCVSGLSIQKATLGTKHRRGNQEWTIQRHGQHWALDTEGAIKNGQSRDIGNNGHQTEKGNQEYTIRRHTTSVTRHRRGNQEWTIQRHRQNWALDTEGAIKNGQSRDIGSLDCPFLIAPSVSSAQCCACLWIVHS